MDFRLGLMDSVVVALALGSEAVCSRLRAAHRAGVSFVTSAAAPATARSVLRRIGRAEKADGIEITNGRLVLPGLEDDRGRPLAAEVLPCELVPQRFLELLRAGGADLTARQLTAGYQVADLALRGVRDLLAADDGNFGKVRSLLADVEPFTFLGTGTLACRDGVAALTLAAPAPRGALLA